MNEDQVELLKYLRELQAKFSHFYAILLAERKLTLPQYVFLIQLWDEDEIPMSRLSAKMKITKPAVTHLVDRLEKNGFIRRLEHPHDRRVYLLKLLPKGDRTLKEIQRQTFRHLLSVFEKFKKRERKAILNFHALMASTIDQFLNQT